MEFGSVRLKASLDAYIDAAGGTAIPNVSSIWWKRFNGFQYCDDRFIEGTAFFVELNGRIRPIFVENDDRRAERRKKIVQPILDLNVEIDIQELSSRPIFRRHWTPVATSKDQ